VKQMASLKPNDASSLKEFRKVVGAALRTMIHDGLPAPEEVEVKEDGQEASKTILFQKIHLGRKGKNEQIPVMRITPPKPERILIWIHPAGKSSLIKNGELDPLVEELQTKNTTILAPDVFGTGEFKNASIPTVNEQFAGFTFGYNRPLLANRVHDILTVVAEARRDKNVKPIDLVGFEQAGPWVLLARALCGDWVHRTAVDMNQFRFDNVLTTSDKMMLPGALKYGGLPAFAALCAPGELFLHNHRGMGIGGYVRDAYKAAGQERHFHHQGDKASSEKAVQWLLR
ncbi:MAG TPA: hypothetical protein VGY77_02770, partial [Gemmataceae bacterium]|nr:hypothetical protein [Gemmataceae bacterium]